MYTQQNILRKVGFNPTVKVLAKKMAFGESKGGEKRHIVDQDVGKPKVAKTPAIDKKNLLPQATSVKKTPFKRRATSLNNTFDLSSLQVNSYSKLPTPEMRDPYKVFDKQNV